MKTLLLTLLGLVFFALGSSASANESPDYFPVLDEGFEGAFPPDGWVLEQSNPDYTWRQVTDAFGGLLEPQDGEKFLYIEGDPDGISEATLISSPIDTTSMDFNCTDMYGSLFVAGNPSQFSPDVLSVQLIRDYGQSNETRETVKEWIGWDDGAVLFWLSMDEISFTEAWETTFRVGFKFSGQGGPGIAIDSFYLDCEWYGNNNGQPAPSEGESESDDSSGCSSTPKSHTKIPLITFMVLIGLIAVLFGRKGKGA